MLLPALSKAKVKAQTAKCLNNMKQIGIANTMYLGDSKDKVPYALIRLNYGWDITWDDLMDSYLGGSLSSSNDLVSLTVATNKAKKTMLCPSDKINVVSGWYAANGTMAGRRTYAMPQYTNQAQWPPNATATTGVGVNWNWATSANGNSPNTFTSVTWNNADTNTGNPWPTLQYPVYAAVVQSPENLILVTERPGNDNYEGCSSGCSITTASSHLTAGGNLSTGALQAYHNNLINYLFLDAHAESLQPSATLGRTNQNTALQSGMWTINAND